MLFSISYRQVSLLPDLAPFCDRFFGGSLLFGWLKCALDMGTSENIIAKKKNVKGIVFEERFCILCTLRVVNRNFE